MASVKELRVDRAPTTQELGEGAFRFTDAYSVFDWGQMPDEIPGKGRALCAMGAATFEALEAAEVPTHYRGVGKPRLPTPLSEHDRGPRRMAIELTQVPDLPFEAGEYDYESYHAHAGENYLVPLEIVFRNQVPLGSSLRRRTEPADHDLDFATWPEETIQLTEPIIEFSTKFESSDRYVSDTEADEIAGKAALGDLSELARTVNRVINNLAARADLEHLDGKIECLYHQGTVKVADVAGTLDENRFAYNGHQLSKEVIRQYYKRADPDWVSAVGDAKAAARAAGTDDWRQRCQKDPRPLPASVLETVSRMYASAANAYIGRRLFTAPPLHSVADDLRRLPLPE